MNKKTKISCLFVALYILLCIEGSKGQEVKELEFTEAKLEQVTVYPSQAELLHILHVTLQPGANKLLLHHSPTSYIDDSLLISSLSSSFFISSVSREERAKWVSYKNQSAIEEMEKEITKLSEQIDMINNNITLLYSQISIVNTLNDGRSRSPFNTLNDFSEHLSFVSSLLSEYHSQLSSLTSLLTQTKRNKENMEQEINKEKGKTDQYESERVIMIYAFLDSPKQMEVTIKIRYLSPLAHWFPFYELHFDPQSNKSRLLYYASITQYSSFDWNSVEVILSTKKTNQIKDIGKLKEIYLHSTPQEPASYHHHLEDSNIHRKYGFARQSMILESASDSIQFTTTAGNIALPSSVSSDHLSFVTSYHLSQHHFIPHNPFAPSKVLIGEIDLNLSFHHLCIPKISDVVYLKASAINLSKFFLLPGTLHLFSLGNFVGSSSLPGVQAGDKFEMMLGEDEGVKVEYKSETYKQTEGGFIQQSTSVQHEKRFFSFSSSKPHDITVWVYDQIPISADENIKVTLIEPKTSKITSDENVRTVPSIYMNDQSKVIRWMISVPPSSKNDLLLHYSVTHPQGQPPPFAY